MSPIRAWNGSAWIQPQFRQANGTWRRQTDYKAAVPAVQQAAGDWQFNGGSVEGWTTNPYLQGGPVTNKGGYISCTSQQSGLLSSLDLLSPWTQYYEYMEGQEYRGLFRYRYTRVSGSLPNTVDLTFTVNGTSDPVKVSPEGSSGWLTYQTTAATEPATYYQRFNMSYHLDCGDLEGNSIYTIELDYAYITDKAGNKLIAVVEPAEPEVPAWPKWWDGSTWRG